MAFKTSNNSDHNKFLYELNRVLHGEANAAEKLVAQFFEQYYTMLVNLSEILKKYREVTAKINDRQPLVKRKEPQNK
jgi:hypothetical protein